ncbi:MAG TPA: sigma 54-interacting transcriptional regulator, partial [Thermoanaerobaculia bacterium]|nr:sigma 54-interacting transcriptional regulator [Thermoanaerobaculia bacterium]
HPLASDEVTAGRDASNTLVIADVSVSRKHSVLTRESDCYRIADLDSLNGTFVNGVPVKRRLLQHGDEIEIGTSKFLFLLRDIEEGEVPGVANLEVGEVRLGSTVRLKPEEALYLQPDKLAAALPAKPGERIALDLQVLLNASRLIASAGTLGELGQRLIELAFQAVPAQRGALLLPGEDPDDFVAVAIRDRVSGRPDSLHVSKTILTQVSREKAAILSNDVLESEALRKAGSLVASRVQALTAVPVAALDRLFGVLYLDSRDPEARFAEEDLQLLMGLANMAAAAFENIRHIERLERERARLEAEVPLASDMVGESPAMRRVYQFIGRVAPTDATVLILGESGTGKELAAHAIHRNSARAAQPFVAIHCAALTETLLESELFGHERGSFTGAIAQKKGKLEVADGGTVFLDEVAELPPAAQVKLLRVLQEREFERVGGTRAIHVNIRLITATNKNLEQETAAGRFREDLFYRLNVIALTMPALRERAEDIPLLASYFAAQFGKNLKARISGISPEARAVLLRYDWPGNVRELANAIERAVVLSTGDVVAPEDLPEALLESGNAAELGLATYHDTVNRAKKEVILKATREARGSYAEAAKRLGIDPNYLSRLIRNFNLKGEIQK